MPPLRVPRTTASVRSTPLPRGRYAIASALPPTFGVHELFDWSLNRSSSSSTRSVSAKPSPSVTAWVKDQEGLSLPLSRQDTFSDVISITTTPMEKSVFVPAPNSEETLFASAPIERPLFAPTTPSSQMAFTPMRSSTPIKRKPAQVQPQHRIAQSSLLEPRHLSPSSVSNLSSAPGHTHSKNLLPADTSEIAPSSIRTHSSRPTAPVHKIGSHSQQRPTSGVSHEHHHEQTRYQAIAGISESVDNDTTSSDEESMSEASLKDQGFDSETEIGGYGKVHSESQSDEESEVKSELSGQVRMPVSRYIDYEAREARETKPKHTRVDESIYSVGDQWRGGAQGTMSFRRRPNAAGEIAPGKWSFSNDGAARQTLKGREVGDIHFSPAFSGESGDEYWVVFDHPKRRWAHCSEGQPHPTLPG
ncbi:hypothetical protein FRC09_008247, partial [Ceratobasidium sp. 395]